MLRVRLLGGLALERDGEPIAPPPSRRSRLLAGWLALHPGLHAREALAGRLRPDVLDDSARQSLRQAAWGLRAAVGDDLVATRDAIGFGQAVEVDVLVFDAAAAAGDLDAALAVCRGELLAGLEDDWVLQARDAHAVALDALLARAADAATDRGEALSLARRRAELDPLGEEAHRALMRALAETGDAAAALAVFARLRERLARELGTAPSAATRELASGLRATPAAMLRPADDQAPGRLRTRAVAPLIGRDDALAALSTAWARTGDGTRRLALVSGEPGIGKTRLAAELVARVQAGGGAALAGRCTPEGHIPYAPFAEALGGLAAAAGPVALADAVGVQSGELARLVPSLPGAPQPGDPDGARHRLLAAVDAALVAVARAGGLVLVLDDLHWADEPTLGMLAHLAGSPERARLLVVATLRTTESRAAPALASLLAILRRDPTVLDLRLDGLSPEAAARLADAAGAEGRGAALAARAGGNPLLVEELARAVVEPGGVPSGVRELVAERVGRLGDPAAAVLATAAVAGAEFDLVTIERVAGDGTLDALEAAVAAGLLTEVDRRPGRFAFTHALVRDAVASSMSAARRARTHGRIAEALTDAPPAELAHHWRAAADVLPGARERATAASREAAGEAVAALAFEEAARHLTLALDDLDEEDVALLLELGAAHSKAGAIPQARAAYERARALAVARGDGAALAEAALGLGGVGVTILRVDEELVGRLEEALDALPEDDRRTRARVLGRLGVELYYADDAGRARGETCSAEAVALARATGDPEALGAALHAQRIALWRADRLDERLATTRELIALGERERLLELEVQGRHWHFVDVLESGDAEAADEALERYAEATERLGIGAWSWYVPLWRGCRAAMAGRYAEANALGEEAGRIGTLAGDANAGRNAWIQATAILFEQERYDELEEGPALAALESSAVPGAWHSGLAWVFAARGETERGRHHLDAIARDGWALLPRDANHLACLHECAEAAAYLSDIDRGADLVALLAPYAGRCILNARAVNAYASGAYALGRAATAAGDTEAAAEHLTRAAADNRALGAEPRAALAERRLAEL
jgi:DNA-binding SARP family transcriptional activator/tetratricopeptide (TPR) repeat protein